MPEFDYSSRPADAAERRMSGHKPLATSADRKYTRPPNGSALTHGFVGFSLAAVILLAVAG